MKNKVFVAGGSSYNSIITLDDFPTTKPQTIHSCIYNETIGNTGAGKALSLSKLGFNTVLHSLIGMDDYGVKVIEKLNHSNLELIFSFDPKGTERHLNILNSKGERISIFTNPSTDNPLIDYEEYRKNIASAEYVVINISNYCRNFLPICNALNKEVWTDLHDYDGFNPFHQNFIDASDYIFLSSENFKEYKVFMKKMIDNGKKLVVCTHGKDGATTYTYNEEWFYEPANLDFELINSNGAGDSFFSGFLYAFSKNKSINQCMKYASLAGALCINSINISPNNMNAKKLEKQFKNYYI